MRFSVNGLDQGIAFRVAKSELAGRPLFPHVLTKNQVIVVVIAIVTVLSHTTQEQGGLRNADKVIKPWCHHGVTMNFGQELSQFSLLWYFQDFTVNFGQMPGPLCPLEQGYTPIGQLDFADGIVRFQIFWGLSWWCLEYCYNIILSDSS